MNSDLIRFIDSISRDKNIDKESVFTDLEVAMVSAIRKTYGDVEDVQVSIDRLNGEINASMGGEEIDMKMLGRIAAQTAKQVMIQKIREDERDSIFEEYSKIVGTVVTGTVTRYDSGGLVVNLGRTEAFMPRSEQIPGETHHPGERIRGMILDVREDQSQVRIVLTQTHPDYIRKLFELEVPEVGERIIEVRALAREAGYRTKIAVSSIDSKVDAVGACVGVRGSRIRNIVDELGGEKIDIIRWNESSQILISNSLKPAEIKETFLCFELGRATVVVDEDQLSLAIGKRGQNVRLAARLTGWDIDIRTPVEYNKGVDDMETALKGIEGVSDIILDKMLAMGIISLADIAEVGHEPLVAELEIEEEVSKNIVEKAAIEAERIAKEKEQEKKDQKSSASNSEDKTTEDATVDDSAVDDAAVDDAAVDDSAVDDSAVDDSTVDDATVEDSAVDDTTVEDTAVDETVDLETTDSTDDPVEPGSEAQEDSTQTDQEPPEDPPVEAGTVELSDSP